MGWRSILCSAVAAVFAFSAAQANEPEVQLIKAQGKVLANQGDGFYEAAVGAFLKPGDSLFVGDKASATILYTKDNCEWTVQSGSVLAIDTPSPCKELRIEPAADLPDTAQASVPPNAKAFVPLPLFIVPGLLLGGGAAAAAISLSGEENDDDPISTQ